MYNKSDTSVQRPVDLLLITPSTERIFSTIIPLTLRMGIWAIRKTECSEERFDMSPLCKP